MLILFLAGCSKSNPEKETFQADINIGMKESLEHELMLECSTVKQYECINYSIDNSSAVNGNQVKIEFTGIAKPSICLTAIGPASAKINLGKLVNGSYTISFQTGNEMVSGTLKISGEAYELLLPAPGNIKLINPVLER